MQKNSHKIPKIFGWLLNLVTEESDKSHLNGDYEEIYVLLQKNEGKITAYLWIFRQIFKSSILYFSNSIIWSIIMFKNYLKVALRNILRNKMFSFINISGLALGMACFIMILFWVQYEVSYDKFNKNADNLYRITEQLNFSNRTSNIARTPSALAPALFEEIPEVVNSMRYINAPSLMVAYEKNKFYENGIAFADPSIFEMFTFHFSKGDKKSALNNISSIVISEDMAEKYFGKDDPLNKTLNINNKHDFIVTGVLENVPGNSHLKFDFIIPFPTLENMRGEVGIRWSPVLGNWGINFYYTYVQVVNTTDINQLANKILNFIGEHSSISSIKLFLQPVTKIHLHSNLIADFEDNGDIKYVYIFSIIAFFILFIACINFMNLTTARAGNRAKEVGMRKISGAKKAGIIKQFLGESILLSFIAFITALFIVFLFLPVFNNLSGKELSLNILKNPNLFFTLFFTVTLTSLIAGSYPSVFLSSFRPVNILKGSIKFGPKSTLFRRILVVIQFSLSILLIVATLVVHKQLNFIQNSNLGFEKEHIVYIRLRGNTAQYYNSLKSELLKNPNIQGVTASDQLPTNIIYSVTGANWEGKNPDETIEMNFVTVDYDFCKTLNMEIADGREFSKEFQNDRTGAFILNEKASRILGKESPVGKQFSFFGRNGEIIGVVKNFHFATFYNEINPLVLLYSAPGNDQYLITKITGEKISENLNFIGDTWKNIVPSYPFEYNFLNDDFNRQYKAEQRTGKIFNYFTFLAIFIASLGLFGLVSFICIQRTKEIGIRKAIGASVNNIVIILTKEFIILVTIANIVSWPAGYYFMKKWLNNFVFKTNMEIWTFLFSGITAIMITLLTISYQTIKTARSNPADTLRHE